MSGFGKWKWFGRVSLERGIFSLQIDSIFELLSKLFEKVSARFEGGLGFSDVWSSKG